MQNMNDNSGVTLESLEAELGLTASSVEEIHPLAFIEGYMDDLVQMQNDIFCEWTVCDSLLNKLQYMTEEKNNSVEGKYETIEKYIKENNVKALRICITKICYIDRDFSNGEFDRVVRYVESKGIKLKDDSLVGDPPISSQKSEFTDEDFAMAVFELEENFCDERIRDVKTIGKKLYPRKSNKANNTAKSTETNSNTSKTTETKKKGIVKTVWTTIITALKKLYNFITMKLSANFFANLSREIGDKKFVIKYDIDKIVSAGNDILDYIKTNLPAKGNISQDYDSKLKALSNLEDTLKSTSKKKSTSVMTVSNIESKIASIKTIIGKTLDASQKYEESVNRYDNDHMKILTEVSKAFKLIESTYNSMVTYLLGVLPKKEAEKVK